jgi:hypothetical protein
MIEVWCPNCGAFVGRWLRVPEPSEAIMADDFQRADGSNPQAGTVGIEYCQWCDEHIPGDVLMGCIFAAQQLRLKEDRHETNSDGNIGNVTAGDTGTG